jgi:ElaB/YqjD/DUF883 family membrane-anchored ribosome-binding protein
MKNRLLDLFTSPGTGDGRQRTEPAIDAERLRITAEDWITKNPAVALGAALAVGVFLGWLVKRK